VKFRKVQIKAP